MLDRARRALAAGRPVTEDADRRRAAAVLGGGVALPVGGRRPCGRRLAGERDGRGAGVRRPAAGAPARAGARPARRRAAPAGSRCGSTRTHAVELEVPAAACARCGRSVPSGTCWATRTCRPTASWRSACCPTRATASSSAAVRTSSWPGWSTAAAFTELGRVDGRYLSTEVAGGMTGRMLGVACLRRQRRWSAPSSTSAPTTRRSSRDRRPRRPAQRLRGAHRAPRVGAAPDPAQPRPRPDRPGRRGGVAACSGSRRRRSARTP